MNGLIIMNQFAMINVFKFISPAVKLCKSKSILCSRMIWLASYL